MRSANTHWLRQLSLWMIWIIGPTLSSNRLQLMLPLVCAKMWRRSVTLERIPAVSSKSLRSFLVLPPTLCHQHCKASWSGLHSTCSRSSWMRQSGRALTVKCCCYCGWFACFDVENLQLIFKPCQLVGLGSWHLHFQRSPGCNFDDAG